MSSSMLFRDTLAKYQAGTNSDLADSGSETHNMVTHVFTYIIDDTM